MKISKRKIIREEQEQLFRMQWQTIRKEKREKGELGGGGKGRERKGEKRPTTCLTAKFN